MRKITIGVLTISDRCFRNEATDESGPNLVEMIENSVVAEGEVIRTGLVPDEDTLIQNTLKEWCDKYMINVILTTGGTGLGKRDVTPEATMAVVDKEIPGIRQLMCNRSLESTPLAALSRAMCGVRKKSLIINLPGSKKGSKECLEAVAPVIPHAVDLILENEMNIRKLHSKVSQRKSKVSIQSWEPSSNVSKYPKIEVSHGQTLILESVNHYAKEKTVHFENGLGHVLAQDAIAVETLPPVDVSIKDGYAVQSLNTHPLRTVIMVQGARVDTYSCAKVYTGGPIPEGADAVVQVEDVSLGSKLGDEPDEIYLNMLPVRGQDIRFKGSDFKKGDIVIKSGTYLGPSALGLLAAANITSVKVYMKPLVGVLSTGDEVANPGDANPRGMIRDSNRFALLSLLKQEGYSCSDLGIALDDPDNILSSLEKGFHFTDVVVTTGSMSMGEKDYLKSILKEDFSAEILFGRVDMKPGKPFSFATLIFEGKRKFWFGLPGNPASALVTAYLFLIPALKKMSGFEKIDLEWFDAELTEDVCQEDRPQYCRGILTYDNHEQKFKVKTTGNQISSRISNCVGANCLLLVPKKTEQGIVKNGSLVKVMRIDSKCM